MIGEEVKRFQGTCWYICSAIFTNNIVIGPRYFVHRRDSWDNVEHGGDGAQARVITVEEKNKALLNTIINNEEVSSVQFKVYIKSKSLIWDEFMKGVLQSINGGYVWVGPNKAIKLIEEGQGVWKVHLGSETIYTQISPRHANGRTIENRFPTAYTISGLSFVDTKSADNLTELSIKDTGTYSNIPYKNLFCIKLAYGGNIARNLLSNHLMGKENIPARALQELESAVCFQRCRVRKTSYDVVEKKVEWEHFLSVLRDAKKKINLDSFARNPNFEME
jgi:hypothetical protein